ncbi:MAG: hypothetical protein NZO16_01855 [Deltaproteobacteria bacterium]|nr:hypothetical protein [Deltaproteobacteria bacterium]
MQGIEIQKSSADPNRDDFERALQIALGNPDNESFQAVLRKLRELCPSINHLKLVISLVNEFPQAQREGLHMILPNLVEVLLNSARSLSKNKAIDDSALRQVFDFFHQLQQNKYVDHALNTASQVSEICALISVMGSNNQICLEILNEVKKLPGILRQVTLTCERRNGTVVEESIKRFLELRTRFIRTLEDKGINQDEAQHVWENLKPNVWRVFGFSIFLEYSLGDVAEAILHPFMIIECDSPENNAPKKARFLAKFWPNLIIALLDEFSLERINRLKLKFNAENDKNKPLTEAEPHIPAPSIRVWAYEMIKLAEAYTQLPEFGKRRVEELMNQALRPVSSACLVPIFGAFCGFDRREFERTLLEAFKLRFESD